MASAGAFIGTPVEPEEDWEDWDVGGLGVRGRKRVDDLNTMSRELYLDKRFEKLP